MENSEGVISEVEPVKPNELEESHQEEVNVGLKEDELEQSQLEESESESKQLQLDLELREECLAREVLLVLKRAEEEFDLELIVPPTPSCETQDDEDEEGENNDADATTVVEEILPLKRRSANKANELIRKTVQKLKLNDEGKNKDTDEEAATGNEDSQPESEESESDGDFTDSDSGNKPKRRRRCPQQISNECPLCSTVISSSRNMAAHMALHKSDTQFPCSICKKKFKVVKYLKNHMDRVHGGKKEITGRFIRIEWSASDFLCYYCGKKFQTVDLLKKHKLIHIKSTKFECELCQAVLKSAPCLKQHCETVHLGFPFRGQLTRLKKKKKKSEEPISPEKLKPPTVACDVCGLKFYWGWKLEDHKVSKHTLGGKSHVCSICGKGFKYNSYLNDHMRKHTKEKSYFCETCGKGFRQIMYFRRHVAKLHPEVTLPKRYVYGGDNRYQFPEIDSSIFDKNEEESEPMIEAPSPIVNHPAEFFDPLAEFHFSSLTSTLRTFLEPTNEHFQNTKLNATMEPVVNPEFIEVRSEVPFEYFRSETTEAKPSTQEHTEEDHYFYSPLMEETEHATFSADDEQEEKVPIKADELLEEPNPFTTTAEPKSRKMAKLRTKHNTSKIPSTLLEDEEPMPVAVKLEEGQDDDNSWEGFADSLLDEDNANDPDYAGAKKPTAKRQRLERRKERMKTKRRKRGTKSEPGIKCRLQGCKFQASDVQDLSSHRRQAHGRTDEVRSYNYKCDYPSCSFRARFPDSLAAHRITHEQEKTSQIEACVESLEKKHIYQCSSPGCEKGFSHRGRLLAHLEKDHPGTNLSISMSDIDSENLSTSKSKHPYHCTFPDCGKGFSHRIRLVAHVEKFHNKKSESAAGTEKKKTKYPYYCTSPGCGKGFSHRVRLVGHTEKYHNENGNCQAQTQAKGQDNKKHPYMCTFPGCKRGFPRRLRMLAHLHRFHDENSQALLSASLQGTPSKSKRNCRIGDCKFRAFDRAEIESHRLEVHGAAFVRGIRFKTRKAGGGTSNLVWKYCKVPGCYFRTIRPEIWEFHQRTKHMNLPDSSLTFKCPGCDKSFGSPYYRMVHIKLKHSVVPQGLPRHPCLYCPKDFCNKVILTSHIRRVHRDAPTFSCSFCTKIYYNQDDTVIHEMRHKKHPEIPFRCVVDNCKQVCVSKDGLRAHVGRDHDFPVDARAICPTCGKEFLLINLPSHERIHDTVKRKKCPLCPKDFKLGSCLVRHTEACHPEMFKDQEKRFACEFCGKTFYTKESLSQHRYKHVPRKPTHNRTRTRKRRGENQPSEELKRRRNRKKKEPTRQVEIDTPSPTLSESPPAAHLPAPSNYEHFQQFLQPMDYFHPEQGQMNYRGANNYPPPPPSHIGSLTPAQQQQQHRLYLQRSGFWN